MVTLCPHERDVGSAALVSSRASRVDFAWRLLLGEAARPQRAADTSGATEADHSDPGAARRRGERMELSESRWPAVADVCVASDPRDDADPDEARSPAIRDAARSPAADAPVPCAAEAEQV